MSGALVRGPLAHRAVHAAVLVALLAVVGGAGCRRWHTHRESAALRRGPAAIPRAVVPQDVGPYYPSLARTTGTTGAPDVTLLANTDACGACHVDEAQQWASSAHAHASFDNPWYRAVVDEVRASIGFAASRHCAGCHDPLLLLAGRMDAEIAPSDPLAQKGVTCMLCHGIVETRSDGNASYTLSTDPVPVPRGDAESLAAHKARLATAPLATPALCNTCHRGFLGRHTGLDHHLSGIEEPGAWRASAWAGSHANTLDEVPPRSCIDCHMPAAGAPGDAYGGRARSHRFAGGHSALAARLGDPKQVAAVRAQLESALRIDVPVVFLNGQARLVSDPIDPKPGDRLAFDVVLANTGVGHSFPAGVKDMQDTWIEVTLTDAHGRVLGAAGQGQREGEDPSSYVLRSLVVDARGVPERRHFVERFGAVAYDHTVAPLGARAARYTLVVPDGAAGPLRVDARVRHRRHRLEAREVACEATRSARGKAFAAEARALHAPVVDGCASEPITDLGEASVVLGQSAPDAPDAPPTWRRLYAHAQGLAAGDLQERLGEARWSAERALATVDPKDDPHAAATLFALEGRLAGREGRLAEALADADRAESLIGAHPAIDRVRADAYQRVWRWGDAAKALARVAERAPGDTSVWRDLATTRMSSGAPREALDAAFAGLALQPRDEGLLRCEALSLADLRSPDSQQALAAFVFYREGDDSPASRIACERATPNCKRDRQPVVTIDLRAPPPLGAPRQR